MFTRFSFFIVLLCVACVACAARPLMAQNLLDDAAPLAAEAGMSAPKETIAISAVRVLGNQRIEKETVLSYLSILAGDKVTPDDLDRALKTLYATGLFANVTLDMDGDALVVKVEENPVVNRVTFEGNDALSKEDLEKEVQLKPRLVYTLPRVQKDVQRLLDVYRRGGRFGAVIEPKLVKLPQNRVDVIFEISEGDKTGIRSIAFVGNEHYSGDDLSIVISSRESAWWRFFSTSDYYDPDRTNYDRDLLRRFYLNQGYMDVVVTSGVAELTPDRNDFFLTFTLEEGPRYAVGPVALKSDIKGLDPEQFKALLTVKTGDWYSAERVEKDIAKLTATLGDLQYAFAEIVPEVDRKPDDKTAGITYHIKEGQRVYVGRIDIHGNARTIDKVIRREMLLAEGDPFSTSRVRRSEQRIKDLGFFKDVKVTPEDGGQPDRANLKVDVEEQSTGEISFGAGFSSTDGPLGDFSIRERNFMGRGQDVRLGATVSGVTRQFDFSFTEPYFMDRDLSAGFDLFHVMRDNQNYSSYDETNTGFTLRTGYPLSEHLRQLVSYTLRKDDISNVPSTASRFVRDQQGVSVTSMVGQGLSYDRRDSRLNPTEGYELHTDTDFAGLGGDRRYVRVKAGGTNYVSLAESYVLGTTLEGGYIWGLGGQSVRISDRFFMGGDSLRGFEYGGLGPRDLTNGVSDALGGKRFTRTSVELTTPTPLPDDLGLKGHVFVDAGTLGRTGEEPQAGEIFKDEENVRVGAGVGLTWQSPFGPVRLDIVKALVKKDYDKTETIHFSFGTKF